MKKSIHLLALAPFVLMSSSCGKGSTGPNVASVTVAPSSYSFSALGETKQFTALVKDPNGNAVAGETVIWSSDDETVATVSGSGIAAAVGEGTATVTATVAGVSGTASVDVSLSVAGAPCTDTVDVSLSAGESTMFSGTSTCVMLPSGSTGDHYRVAVVDPSTLENTDTVWATLQVTGIGVAAAPPSGASRLAGPVQTAPLLSPAQEATLRHDLAVQDATRRLHLAMRARERQLFSDLASEGRLNLPPPRTTDAATAPALASPSKMTFEVSTNGCTVGQKATGILLYENNDLAFYQDSAQNKSSPASLSNLQMMGDYYSSYAKDMLTHYWGAMPDIDGNGKVIVFISPIVTSNAAAFVWAGDLLSKTDCAASNEAEIMYFNNSLILELSAGNPSYQALETTAHEAKHVISLYNRLAASIAAGGADLFQPGWVEEGTAEVSGEMSSRIAWAANGGPPVGAEVTRSDMANGNGGINVTPEDYGVLLRMVRTIDYLSSQPNSLTSTPLGADSSEDIYGSGWDFHRWLGDAYGGAGGTAEADSSLFRALTDSLAAPEPSSLQNETGKSFEQLFEEYVTAMSLTGTGSPQPARAYTTYDLVSCTSNLLQSQPAGIYPWVVTPSGTGFQSGTYKGPVGNGGIRIHDFVSNGTGTGALLQLTMKSPARLIVVRLQ